MQQYRNYRAEGKTSPAISEWEECIRDIFTGAIPSDEDMEFLTTDNFLHDHGPQFPSMYILQAIICHHSFRTDRLLVNRHTEHLMDVAAEKLAGIGSTTTLLAENTKWRRNDVPKEIGMLKGLFPDQMKRLLHRAIDTGMRMTRAFMLAFDEDLDKADLKRILPEDAEALAQIAASLGDDLSDEYYAMSDGMTPYDSYKFDHSNGEHPAKTLLEALPEPYLSHFRAHIGKIFSAGSQPLCHVVAQSKNATPDMLGKALAYLSGLATQHQLMLGNPYAIPKNLSGTKLCRLLTFLEKNLDNPVGMISGIPDQADFAARTIEMDFNSDTEETKLKKAASEARDRLIPKVSGHVTSCSTLYTFLTKVARNDGAEELLNSLRSNYNLPAKDILLTFSCLFDIQRCMRKAPQEIFKRVGFDNIAWSEEPSEKTAFAILTQLKKYPKLMELANHTEHRA